MRMRLVLQALLFVFVLSVGVRADMGGCQEFTGEFTSTLVFGPECESPVGICTHGVLTGEIEGTYDFVMTELNCPDDDNPNNCTYAGDSIVTTDKGTIITVDTGVMRGAGLPFLAEFTTTAEFVSGANRYKNASGVFVATGLLNFVSGQAVGEYSLQVCHGK